MPQVCQFQSSRGHMSFKTPWNRSHLWLWFNIWKSQSSSSWTLCVCSSGYILHPFLLFFAWLGKPFGDPNNFHLLCPFCFVISFPWCRFKLWLGSNQKSMVKVMNSSFHCMLCCLRLHLNRMELEIPSYWCWNLVGGLWKVIWERTLVVENRHWLTPNNTKGN